MMTYIPSLYRKLYSFYLLKQIYQRREKEEEEAIYPSILLYIIWKSFTTTQYCRETGCSVVTFTLPIIYTSRFVDCEDDSWAKSSPLACELV